MASSTQVAKLEKWLDDLTTERLMATVPVTSTGGENNLKSFKTALKNISGWHDIFVKNSLWIINEKFISNQYVFNN